MAPRRRGNALEATATASASSCTTQLTPTHEEDGHRVDALGEPVSQVAGVVTTP